MEAIKLEILKFTANELNLKEEQVRSTIELFDDGATVPFIARYRKEITGNLDEEQIRDIIEKVTYYRNLEKRKEEVLKSIDEQGKLTDDLKKSILDAVKLQVVEDLYYVYEADRCLLNLLKKGSPWYINSAEYIKKCLHKISQQILKKDKNNVKL